ncbi:MAG: DUF479 domain-containing protein [Bacteroidales bacterium]|nr:DUF479 domain-containing protein [Bacteroidales bacterium]
MNFLAHLYLSGSDVEIRLGNFIGDYVKGKSFDQYPVGVQKGIILHRDIDTFTDKHQSTRECINLLRPGYGKYAGVVVDVLFDHVLANEWYRYSESDLKWYTRKFYLQMVLKYSLLPVRVREFLPFMIHSNRLYSYRTKEGLGKAIEIMSSVTSLPSKPGYAIETLDLNYEGIFRNFNMLFPEMMAFVGNKYGIQF